GRSIASLHFFYEMDHLAEVQKRFAALELESDRGIRRFQCESHDFARSLGLQVITAAVGRHRLRIHMTVSAVEIASLRQNDNVQRGSRVNRLLPQTQVSKYPLCVLRR